ncbi:hypothetical protein FXO37_30505 [Capsicum annuum]|nr:hypothetical protein FXO37_30505 [Capsicum annuum]
MVSWGEIDFSPPPKYIGGSVTEFFAKDVDVDMMSYFDLRDHIKYLGYSIEYDFFVKWYDFLVEIKCDKVIYHIVSKLKNGNELEVCVSQGVSKPVQAPLELEYFPNTSKNGVGGENLNPINEGDASSPNFQPSTPNSPSNPPDESPPSNIPSKSFDLTIDEDPSDDDLEDDLDLEGKTILDSDVDRDVHQ